MKILLVGNYVPDRQHSMLGFTALMEQGLQAAGHEVQTFYPPVVFGRLSDLVPPAHKWLAYLDKLLLFPWLLRQAVRNTDIVHICDHSNALYIPQKKRVPYVVTCHDLLAVRGSLGEDTDCPASGLGKILQQWILRGLKRADGIACASTATYGDVRRLLPEQQLTEILPLSMRYNLNPLSEGERNKLLKSVNGLDPQKPFVLHVGSSQPRKNREGVLRVFAKFADRVDAQLLFAGKRLEPAQEALARQLKVADRVVQTGEISNSLLAALYGGALAFLFPSRFEGFGWPIVEAQSLACPVVCSSREPFPEVAGDGALLRDVDDEQGFADDLVRLAHEPKFHSDLIDKGSQNALRYRPETMISRYMALYARVLVVRGKEKVEAPLRDAHIKGAQIQEAYIPHRPDRPVASAEVQS